MARHRALGEVWDHGDRLGRSKYGTYTHHRQGRPKYRLSKSHPDPLQSITVISDTNCPVALVPAPPAVTVRAPAVVTVPARFPAVPAA